MKSDIQKSIKRTSFGFLIIITYCIASLLYKFSYLDFGYLLVVIGYFIAYLKVAKKI